MREDNFYNCKIESVYALSMPPYIYTITMDEVRQIFCLVGCTFVVMGVSVCVDGKGTLTAVVHDGFFAYCGGLYSCGDLFDDVPSNS